MKLEVEVISKEMVEPSSPTPDHLRHYKLSFIDQTTDNIYIPLIYFYESNGESNFVIDFKTQLKNSLSQVLTHYHPLAGRPDYDSFLIHCNDAGVPFVEARVNSTLSDIVHKSFPDDLNKLFPFKLDEFNKALMGVQLNIFECGGVAVAVAVIVSHKIVDGKSLVSINNIWAAIARSEKDALRPHLEGAKLFPPKEISFDSMMMTDKDRVARRFVFEALKLEAIRAKYAENTIMENQTRPSRILSLTAFIYSRVLAAIKDDSPQPNERSHMVNFTMNVRPRMDPPLPDDAFGNYYYDIMTFPSAEVINDEHCYGLVKQLREEINKVNKDYLEEIQNEHDSLLDSVMDIASKIDKGEIVICNFTSFCRFPLYDADFGWGKPVWVTLLPFWYKNLIVFLDSKGGDAIDAIIHLQEQDMAKLENDKEFLKFATPTPQ